MRVDRLHERNCEFQWTLTKLFEQNYEDFCENHTYNKLYDEFL